MKRPLHVWAAFLLCLVVLAAGMAWLTIKAIESDRARAEARRQQELLTVQGDFEGDVRLALRRMDQYLAELFADESAWPHFAYDSFYLPQTTAASEKDATVKPQPVASPLLLNPNADYVNLYFQIDAGNNWLSPMLPADEQKQLAVQNGLSLEQLKFNESQLFKCQSLVRPKQLLDQLPAAQQLAVAPADSRFWNEVAENAPPVQRGASNEEISNAVAQQSDQPLAQPEARGPQQEELQQLAQSQSQQQKLQPEGQQLRSNAEFLTRQRQFGQYASKWNSRIQQRESLYGNDPSNFNRALPQSSSGELAKVIEGRSRPIWVDEELVLARRVRAEDRTILQGVWLDWAAIRSELGNLVADLLPAITIMPVHAEAEADLGRMLATLPAQLVVTAPEVVLPASEAALSPIWISLIAAWGCLILAALAVAFLLAGVLALSERRAAFVSAVTHELRTPLTTFRMYAEMLAEGMVPDGERRKNYLQTLKSEADRLFHLVENVLSYAQLERSGHKPGKAVTVTVAQLMDGMQRRLTERADRAEMSVVVDIAESAKEQTLATDVAAVEQIVINLVDNACKYASPSQDRRIHLTAERTNGSVLLCVRDHGPGIRDNERRRLFRPFTKSASEAAHTAPGVGLGLALCRRMAKQLGGQLWLDKANGDGACFMLKLPAQTA